MEKAQGDPDRQRSTKNLGAIGSPAIALLVVAGLTILVIAARGGAEAAMAQVAAWLPLGYAFAAGMVASVNPCGFMMLPSYVSYHLGIHEEGYAEQPVYRRAGRALAVGLAATTGFLIILAIVGGVIAAGGRWLIDVFPYAGVAVGGIMVAGGLYLLVTRKSLGIVAAGRMSVGPQRNLRNALLYGIVYATGSLSCTLPIFMVVVGSSLASGGLAGSFIQFISYGLGMGVILIAVTLGAALFRGTLVRWLRAVMPHVHRISALFLTGAGAYLVYYWVFIAGL